jgi:hypothetical protein
MHESRRACGNGPADDDGAPLAGTSAMVELPAGLWVLLVLAMPIASISWTVTHEEVLREPREYCLSRSQHDPSALTRKFFYLFTCEYCFSHWVTAAMLLLTNFRLVFEDWRGYLVAGLALVWTANHYMALYGRLRLGIKSERLDVSIKEDLRKNG